MSDYLDDARRAIDQALETHRVVPIPWLEGLTIIAVPDIAMIEIESQPENIVPMSGLFPYKRPDGRTAYVILLSDELAAKIFSEED